MDIRGYNRKAWDKNVEEGLEFTVPVDAKTIEEARRGEWRIYLTPTRPVPLDWFPGTGWAHRAGQAVDDRPPVSLEGLEVLCLASGGGQQGPVLAAAGARVAVLDNSPAQLAQDRLVAEREGLTLITVEGDMADMGMFPDANFDLIVHPVSNLFVPHILPVWLEAFRVLRPGGVLLSGFMNPVFYLFDRDLMDEQGILQVRHPLPYSDLNSLTPEALQRQMEAGWPLEFGHTLEDQISGQLQVGFLLAGFYEDRDMRSVLDEYMPIYLATRALKPPLQLAARQEL